MMPNGLKLAFAVSAALLATPMVAACSREQSSTPPDRIIDTTADDEALNAAMKQASDTLEVFWAKFEGKPPGVSDYVIKLGMTGQDGFQEFIWADPIRREGDQVVARLANEPVHLRGLRSGSEVRVSQSLIADWSYARNGKLYGHFSTRVLLPKMTPEERAQVEGQLSSTPLEPNAS